MTQRPLSTSETELRLRCVELAIQASASGDTVADARLIHDFVTGQSDGTPRQIIEHALERAGVR